MSRTTSPPPSNMTLTSTTAETRGASNYVKPKTRQRIYKAPAPLEVPNIDEDAIERKRVLNVLAQRRYRERKRQSKSSRGSNSQGQASDQSDDVQHDAGNDASFRVNAEESYPTGDVAGCPTDAESNILLESILTDGNQGLEVEPDLSWPGNHFNDMSVSTVMHGITLLNGDNLASQLLNQTSSQLSNGGSSSSTVSSDNLLTTIDPSTLLESTSSSEDATFSFPDSYLLPVSELTLLRAFLRIATRLGCTSRVWDLTACSPFYSPDLSTLSLPALPKQWQPTPSQLTVPHHPVLDFFPWPSVRERVIAILDLPDTARPPNATGPLAVVQLVYDMEDSAEGMRVWGANPCDASSWEVGQVLFERWWFIFDRAVIEQSNRWRELRGALELSLKGPQIGAQGEAVQSPAGLTG